MRPSRTRIASWNCAGNSANFKNWLEAHHPRDKQASTNFFKKNFVFTGGEIVGEFLLSTGYLPGARATTIARFTMRLPNSVRPGCAKIFLCHKSFPLLNHFSFRRGDRLPADPRLYRHAQRDALDGRVFGQTGLLASWADTILAGHATRPEDMVRARYSDSTASVEDTFNLLHGTTKRIFLVGLSMGGILSLLMSTRLQVAGVVAMSTPYALPDDPRLRLIGLLSLFLRYMPKSKDPPGTGWFDKEAYAVHVSYPQNPLRSIGELNKLLGAMRAALPEVEVPVMLVHSKNDTYVPPESMEKIFRRTGHARQTDDVGRGQRAHHPPRTAARAGLPGSYQIH